MRTQTRQYLCETGSMLQGPKGGRHGAHTQSQHKRVGSSGTPGPLLCCRNHFPHGQHGGAALIVCKRAKHLFSSENSSILNPGSEPGKQERERVSYQKDLFSAPLALSRLLSLLRPLTVVQLPFPQENGDENNSFPADRYEALINKQSR